MFDLMPPMPRAIRIMATASPGIPAPLSREAGSEVANMMVFPHSKRLVLSSAAKPQQALPASHSPNRKYQRAVPTKPHVRQDSKQRRCQERADKKAIGDRRGRGLAESQRPGHGAGPSLVLHVVLCMHVCTACQSAQQPRHLHRDSKGRDTGFWSLTPYSKGCIVAEPLGSPHESRRPHGKRDFVDDAW